MPLVTENYFEQCIMYWCLLNYINKTKDKRQTKGIKTMIENSKKFFSFDESRNILALLDKLEALEECMEQLEYVRNR